MTRRTAAALAILALLVHAGASRASAQASEAPPPDAHRLFLRGAAAYGDARYEDAVALFEQAYELAPEPTLLYNLGLARERAGHAHAAIETYERFLSESPDAPERTEVERSIELLRRHQALEDEVARRAATPPPAAPDEPEPEPEPARRTSTEAVGWIVAGLGGGAVIAGAVVGGLAQSAYDQARTEGTHLRGIALERDAADLGLAANVLFGVGGGLAFIGLVWGVVEASAPSEQPRVEVRAGPAHASIHVTF